MATSENKLELRKYQIELAEFGLQGKNVIICAPTGSGKTPIAMKIAFEHLAKDAKHRVGFIVDKGHLVTQQAESYTKYAPDNVKVRSVSGGHNLLDTAVPLKRLITTNEVIVMTVAILLNALNEKTDEGDRLSSICEFSLLIFDECHHCDKKHPYHQLMNYYFKEKYDRSDRKLPQIVGLTASPGTGKASRSEDAINHILAICARLDAHKLVKTEVNVDDLEEHQNNPNQEIKYARMRSTDFLNDELNRMMNRTETLLESLLCNLDLSLEDLKALKPCQPHCNRGGHKYTNYIGNMFNVLSSVVDEEIYKGVYACWWYLKVLNLSLILNWLFTSSDAVNFVKRHLTYRDTLLHTSIDDDDEIDELDNDVAMSMEPTCEVDKILREELAEMLLSTEGKLGVPEFESENNVLATLKNIVISQFQATDDSRIIIFVKERSYATAMLHYLQTHESLSCFGSKKLVGANASSLMEGQTHSQQSDSVKAFHAGDFKILVATTIAEEGLDIGKCNLVIRYAFVTNEIAMVQSKGRGRAKDSRYIVIVPEHENWIANKEFTNRHRDEMMKLAIDKINKMSDEEYLTAIQDIQRKNEHLRQISVKTLELKMAQSGEKNEGDIFNLHCVKCHTFACASNSLRKAQNIHYVSIDEELLLNKRILLSRQNPKAYGKSDKFEMLGKFHCAKCNQIWGSLCNIDDVTFPNVGISYFHFKNANSKSFVQTRPKKWKDTERYFSVPLLTQDEILLRVNGPLGPTFEILDSDSGSDTDGGGEDSN